MLKNGAYLNMKKNRLNGALFGQMLLSGLNNLRARQKEINEMNVFPVPDGDTGTNMALTLGKGVENAGQKQSLGEYLKALSEGMLMGARGNSGVILSQLFKGFYVELAREDVVNPGQVRDALISAYKTAYRAVIHPVEGTMLTVAREGIENVKSQIYGDVTIGDVFSMYLAEMKKSVMRTPDMLPELREAGVLDSGAVGYIAVVEGMVKAFYGNPVTFDGQIQTAFSPDTDKEARPSFDADSKFVYGYCTEFLLQLLNDKADVNSFDERAFTEKLLTLGDSLVVIRDDSVVKVHVHTKFPAPVIEEAQRYGEFISFKLENMTVQHTEKEQKEKENETPRKALGIIAVAEGEGTARLLSGVGADIVLRGGQTINTPSSDFVAAYKKINADKIVVLPDNGNIFTAATQAKEITGMQNVTIIPTKSVMEGYYALAMATADIEDSDERITAMQDGAEGVTTLFVAKAVKDYSGGEVKCRKGDFVAFIGSRLVAAESDVIKATIKGLQKVPDIESKCAFTMLKGLSFSGDDQDALERAIEEKFDGVETTFLYGGQSVYDLVIGIL